MEDSAVKNLLHGDCHDSPYRTPGNHGNIRVNVHALHMVIYETGCDLLLLL